uniref:chitinase n=1 Tax=Sus scrofa TaxID=9823 RepID=A0A8D1JCR0_PIG
LQEMLTAFDEEAKNTGRPRLLITAAVSAGKGTIDAGYEIAEIGNYVNKALGSKGDFLSSSVGVTEENLLLGIPPRDEGDVRYFNCEFAMKYWRANGVPSEKLLMGFPTYGRTFRLSTSDTSVCAPVSGAGSSGPYTREAGFWASYEVCTFLNGATKVWIEDQKVPYAYKDTEWVGYDNIESYGYKVDFLKENNLGGAMVWAIDLDDFSGSFCNEGKYPLISKLKSLLGLSSGSCSSVHQPPRPESGGDGGSGGGGGEGGGDGGSGGDDGFCTGKADGIYSDPKDSTKYYQCAGGRTFHFQCAQGLVFDENCKCCNWP